MRKRLIAILAYMGAALTLAIAACTPFVLIGVFAKAVARTGVQVDAVYTGGAVARTLMRSEYQIDVYRPVHPHALQQGDPFVQLAFRPASALPRRFSDEIDLDGDGQPDVRIGLTVPTNPNARPTGEVVALNAKYRSFRIPGGAFSFSQLMAQSNGAVLVRVTINKEGPG